MPPAPADEGKSETGNASPTANLTVAEASKPANTVGVVPLTPPAPEPALPPTKETAEEKLITELPDIAVSGRQWLRKLPEDSFVLEHKTFGRVKDAQAFIRRNDYLVNARIVPVFKDGKEEARFVVVTGYFRTKERAKNTIARLGLPSEVTVTPTELAVSQSQIKKSKP
jgi:septal ring-binding cell division protein DamX